MDEKRKHLGHENELDNLGNMKSFKTKLTPKPFQS